MANQTSFERSPALSLGLRAVALTLGLLLGGQQAAAGSQTAAAPEYAEPPPIPGESPEVDPNNPPEGVTIIPAPATQPAPPQPAVTQPVAMQQPFVPTPAPPRFRPRGRGMMTGGFVMFGVGYLTAAVTGAVMIDTSPAFTLGGYSRVRSYGRRLMVPVIGPYIAVPKASTASGKLFTIMWGTLQIAGLGMAIAGLVMYTKDIRRHRAGKKVARLQVGPGQMRLQW